MAQRIEIRQPDSTEFEKVKQYAKDFGLDDGDMYIEQFKVLLHNRQLAAFGRLRESGDTTELCTIGVIKEYRDKGLGKDMVKHLLKDAKPEVHLATVIPDFFRKLGFEPVHDFPASMDTKRQMCATQHHGNMPITVMKYLLW